MFHHDFCVYEELEELKNNGFSSHCKSYVLCLNELFHLMPVSWAL